MYSPSGIGEGDRRRRDRDRDRDRAAAFTGTTCACGWDVDHRVLRSVGPVDVDVNVDRPVPS